MELDRFPYEDDDSIAAPEPFNPDYLCADGECYGLGAVCFLDTQSQEAEIIKENLRRRFREPIRSSLTDEEVVRIGLPPSKTDIIKEEYVESVRRMKSGETGDNMRKDDGKPSGYWLIPSQPLEELAKLYAMGAAKYSPRGWEAGMEWHRIYDPMMRHIQKWLKGETHDAVDGQHHMAAVAWAAFALMEYERTHPELDDIHPKSED